jgi:hypothetical protein
MHMYGPTKLKVNGNDLRHHHHILRGIFSFSKQQQVCSLFGGLWSEN